MHERREVGGLDNQRLDNWERVVREHSRSVADRVQHTDRAWEAGLEPLQVWNDFLKKQLLMLLI